LIFRHYVTAAHRKLDEIVKLLGDTGGSPVRPETDGHRLCKRDRQWCLTKLDSAAAPVQCT